MSSNVIFGITQLAINPKPYLGRYPQFVPKRPPTRVTIELPHPDDVHDWLVALGDEQEAIGWRRVYDVWVTQRYRADGMRLRGHMHAAERSRTRGVLHCARAVKPVVEVLRMLDNLAFQAERVERHHRTIRKQRHDKKGVLL